MPSPDDPNASASSPSASARAALDEAIAKLGVAASPDEVRAIDAEYLGRTSVLTSLKAALRDLPADDRKAVGKALNEARRELEAAVETRLAELEAVESRVRLESERLDLSEVVATSHVGHRHLVTRTWELLEDVFVGMGYTVAEGPEIESDWYNFEALNMPPDHSARSMWDTLYLDVGEPETVLLRTHTSPVQIRTMLESEPPIYIVAPGRAFRRDTADATHLPVFHQIEGLVVDRGITFADLAGTIEMFVKALFGDDRTTRLRPSYFPFTEPSAEFDMSRPGGGWIELGGCGMVHPNVLRAGGIDPEVYTGFAFGFGIDRLAMQLHGLEDLRELVTNDVRFLRQF
ncbi:MAG TPA: phenylalanine--tRNA ligase subunit alpha [Microthrixaceae bacterium]|nr:phenylalanine--tRNA ligase subunit alpha [Microthrixaceae bacterium]